MKILCVCEHGNNRSANLAKVLRYKYYAETIPTGTLRVSESTLRMLCEWADYIIVVEDRLATDVIREYKTKLRIWPIGPDIWGHTWNQELNQKCKEVAEMFPLG